MLWHEQALAWEDVVTDDEGDFANVADCHGMVVADIDGDGLQVCSATWCFMCSLRVAATAD